MSLQHEYALYCHVSIILVKSSILHCYIHISYSYLNRVLIPNCYLELYKWHTNVWMLGKVLVECFSILPAIEYELTTFSIEQIFLKLVRNNK